MIRTWKQALFIVQPETLLQWHRQRFKLYWKYKSRAASAKPKIAAETVALIKQMTGGHLNPIQVLRMFKKILEQAGLPDMPFHDLRHSAATILISIGIHPKVIQELLGHSDISITLGIYGHLFPSMQQDVVDKLQGVFGEKDEDGEEDGGAVLGDDVALLAFCSQF